MVVNRSNLYVGQTVFFVHKEYNSLTKMKEDSIVECKITKIGRVYITINNGYPNRQFFIKSGNDTSFVFRRKKMQLMVEFYALQEKMQKNIF